MIRTCSHHPRLFAYCTTTISSPRRELWLCRLFARFCHHVHHLALAISTAILTHSMANVRSITFHTRRKTRRRKRVVRTSIGRVSTSMAHSYYHKGYYTPIPHKMQSTHCPHTDGRRTSVSVGTNSAAAKRPRYHFHSARALLRGWRGGVSGIRLLYCDGLPVLFIILPPKFGSAWPVVHPHLRRTIQIFHYECLDIVIAGFARAQIHLCIFAGGALKRLSSFNLASLSLFLLLY